jgi:protein TonB
VAPAKTAPPRPAVNAASPKASAANFGSANDAQQAASGFLAAAPVWEGKARYRHPPNPPTYPPRAVELNQQGEAVIRVRLDAEGATVEVVLFRGTGFELLDRAAVAAVRGWHFLPAMREGRAVPAWVEIPVRFRLQ